jgi:hypothetical protein
VDWLDHTNVPAGSDGSIVWFEDLDTNTPGCFYRLRWP